MAISGRPADVLASLLKHATLSQHPMAKPALEDMTILIKYAASSRVGFGMAK